MVASKELFIGVRHTIVRAEQRPCRVCSHVKQVEDVWTFGKTFDIADVGEWGYRIGSRNSSYDYYVEINTGYIRLRESSGSFVDIPMVPDGTWYRSAWTVAGFDIVIAYQR